VYDRTISISIDNSDCSYKEHTVSPEIADGLVRDDHVLSRHVEDFCLAPINESASCALVRQAYTECVPSMLQAGLRRGGRIWGCMFRKWDRLCAGGAGLGDQWAVAGYSPASLSL